MSTLGRWLLLSSLVFASAAFAQVPLQLHYQGYLGNAAGVPVNTPTGITFKLYATQAAPVALWAETHDSVPVANGSFNVKLGSQQPLSLPVFDGARWLGVLAARCASAFCGSYFWRR